MDVNPRRRRAEPRWLVGAFVTACLVLHQLLVPLHLLLEDHFVCGGEREHAPTRPTLAHAHGHGLEHGHEHARPDGDLPGEDHKPHPVDDHVEELVAAAVPPTSPAAPLALSPAEPAPDAPVRPSHELLPGEEVAPGPPPPGEAPAPRAPPVVS